MQLILASQSPRRRQLLSGLGYTFQVEPSLKEEVFDPALPVDEALIQVAMGKAQDILQRHPDDVILAADTIVYDRENVLGKPRSPQEAFETLRSLSGRSHEVKTSVVLISRDHVYPFVETSRVFFKELSDQQIQDYVDTGTCLDKAGSYGIQDVPEFIDHVEGSYSNVVGLPIAHTDFLLKEIQRDPSVIL